MGYMEIVSIVMTILGAITIVFPLQYAIIFIFGLFAKRKTFPKTEEKLKYGVIICARNEEKVVGNLIESIRKCDYPQDKLDVFVIAHNCTDKTAEVARQNEERGSIVYEYNNDKGRTKGYALKHVFECIEKDYGIQSYDGFFIFDADNVLDGEFFNKMNDAFIACGKQHAITSFRNSKNFGTNWITASYGILYITGCTLESGGRNALKLSSRILGSGFLVSSEMVKDGWNIVILSDDTDFTIEQVLKGKKVIYCDEAMYYDEHPTTLKAMWRQRLRWAKGTLIVCKKRFSELFKTIFGCKKKRTFESEEVDRLRGSSFDLACTVFPVGLIGFIVLLINIILLVFAPLFGYDATTVWRNWAILFTAGLVFGYLALALSAIICYIKERKRIKDVPFHVKFVSVLLYPFFTLMLVPLQIVALFTRRFVWTPIEHKDTASHESFNDKILLNENEVKEKSK